MRSVCVTCSPGGIVQGERVCVLPVLQVGIVQGA